MIKMVVSSFFNTLIDYEEAIPSSTMIEIDRIRNKKILFSVCTNRDYREVLDYNRDFPFIDYIISLNGSYVYDVKNSKCLFSKKITETNINKINKLFDGYKIKYYTEDKVLKKYNHEDIYKIEVEIKDEKEIEKLTKINLNYSIFNYNKKMYLEFVNSRVSMFSGVDQLSLRCGIKLKEVLVIGGNDSDISLVSNIPNSYVVENGSDKLKKASSKITSNNNSKGVEKVLKEV